MNIESDCDLSDYTVTIYMFLLIVIPNIAGLHMALQNFPSPSNFDGLPFPRGRWYPPTCFIKMTAKTCKNYYKGALGHFIQRLKCPKKKQNKTKNKKTKQNKNKNKNKIKNKNKALSTDLDE